MPAPPIDMDAPRTRRLFANRTLNLRSISAIGYDMDYTLIHYRFEEWEGAAYAYIRSVLAEDGWPVAGLTFDPERVIRGLIIDSELGNIVKANRFGYVVRAFHGTRQLPFEEQRTAYSRTMVDLADDRWRFLNTLFSLSEGCLFQQLVDLYDEHVLPGVTSYRDMHRRIRSCLDRAHVEGRLKAEIVSRPDRFVERDPEAAAALLDQRRAGKRLMMITNAEWPYVAAMMQFAYDPYLPKSTTWRDLFELVLVQARKPTFFSASMPLFEVVSDDGLVRPVAGGIPRPGAYVGGDATQVEEYLRLSGDAILYVGDHIWADVRVSKSLLRWRTALILRELEAELLALEAWRSDEHELVQLMAAKEQLEHRSCQLRLRRSRVDHGEDDTDLDELSGELETLRAEIERMDQQVAPLARAASEIGNPYWGPLMRSGNDKSHLARQLERSADVYTSRVSNWLWATPFAYLRSSRGSLPHDPPTSHAADPSPRPGER